MSSNSLKQTPTSSNCSGNRSITDIIQSLKTSFLETDFRAAVKELRAREEGLRREKEEIVASLREKSDILEAELGELKVQKYLCEEERRRLLRESDINDDKCKDLARELSLAKEKEESANKRYGRSLGDLRGLEEEKQELIQNLSDMSDTMSALHRKLREKDQEIDELVRKKDSQFNAHQEELEGVQRRNVFLEEEKLNYDVRFEELKKEKEEKIKELFEKKENEKRQVEAQFKCWREELDGMRKMNVSLEEQKAKSDALAEELRRINQDKDATIKKLSEDMEVLERGKIETAKEKDKLIEELVKEKESLVVEKREFTAKLGKVEERFSKLEGDVITGLCLDLGKYQSFASTHIGKILCGIIKALDSEEIGLTCDAGLVKYGNPQEADSAVVSCVNTSRCCLKSDKQSVEDVQRKLDFDAEHSREGGGTGNERTPIIIDDDDDENPKHAEGGKNKRHRPGSVPEWHNHDGSSDDSLNPKLKTRKLEYVHSEQVKQEPSLDAFSPTRRDHKFITSQSQKLATIKRCEVSRGGQIDTSKKDDDRKGSDKMYNYGTPIADRLLSPQVEDYMTTLRQRKQNKKLECSADMICAFKQDFDFCAKAVCALHRKQKSGSSGVNGSVSLGSKGLKECDFERVSTLAKFLIDGDPNGKMKKSVDELQEHDRDDCRELATKYARQLIDIYTRREDPFFSPMSSDLQYK
ncbi:hypothetical protein BVRB_4g075340 [Beta vulgaris subsp. vulgaris]|uniref:uncharacterized protein LOC104890237 n=1 Tax=Beta vulgaris subsp. vulgaris TaxID=3555 RepID=UPI00053F7AE3|nr:uncharacterized protein LOC104890237 [Beta vulgaris subsp. vulgaris]XP_048499549.1 uncharacterized protein LOC104890237 [Beta vulgaris subsp. vulgaris]KMT14768.1 hypothetical protein BVRB_4g075340 [Beta vulgaris subsp. vulgaris]